MIHPLKISAFAILSAIFCFSETASAQFANTTIQLPTISTTSFSSAFSVPDGGTINLSSIGSRDYLPKGIRSSGSGSTTASANVLIMKELEQEMLSNAAPQLRPAAQQQQKINGTPKIQSKADFISRNINRR